jgi:ADP-heptose:LPS heptosyltransferase
MSSGEGGPPFGGPSGSAAGSGAPPSRRATPLTGRHLARNPLLVGYLRLSDALSTIAPTRAGSTGVPRRIVVAVSGHVGDAIISSAVVAAAVRAFPQAEIGVLLPSWSRMVFDGHPAIRWVHTIDHWRIARNGASVAANVAAHRRSLAEAVGEMREVGYDAAIDTGAFWPNMGEPLWRAGIPVRVGFASGGFRGLYTHSVEWKDGEIHEMDRRVALVGTLAAAAGAPTVDAGTATYDLPPAGEGAERAVTRLLEERSLEPPFALIHPGSGNAIKEWAPERWRGVAGKLAANGFRVLLTGSSGREQRICAAIATGNAGVHDLSGALGWRELVEVVGRVSVVMCGDTAVGHAAAAVGTPVVVLWTGTADPAHWKPAGDRCTVLMNEVRCAPCHRSGGCEGMECVRGITEEQVVAAAERAASLPPLPGIAAGV